MSTNNNNSNARAEDCEVVKDEVVQPIVANDRIERSEEVVNSTLVSEASINQEEITRSLVCEVSQDNVSIAPVKEEVLPMREKAADESRIDERQTRDDQVATVVCGDAQNNDASIKQEVNEELSSTNLAQQVEEDFLMQQPSQSKLLRNICLDCYNTSKFPKSTV